MRSNIIEREILENREFREAVNASPWGYLKCRDYHPDLAKINRYDKFWIVAKGLDGYAIKVLEPSIVEVISDIIYDGKTSYVQLRFSDEEVSSLFRPVSYPEVEALFEERGIIQYASDFFVTSTYAGLFKQKEEADTYYEKAREIAQKLNRRLE